MKEIKAEQQEREIIVGREEVKERLKNLLLERKEPICIAIKGEWGVGKTHLWKEFVNSELIEKKHAYISLFGKYSLEDIKIDLTLQLSKFRKFANDIGKVLKEIKPVNALLGSIGSLLSLLTLKEFKDVIVCFDEFERLSPNLKIKEVFGFISYLKENLNCKVVLILDEERINQDQSTDQQNANQESSSEAKVYNQYKEKIVDYEIVLNPSAGENLEIVINKEPNVSKSFKQAIKDVAHSLNIKNIRILRRLVNALKDFSFIEEIIKPNDDIGYAIKLNFYRKLCLLTYIACKYNKTDGLYKLLKEIIIEKYWKPLESGSKGNLKQEDEEEKEISSDVEKYLTSLEEEPVSILTEDVKSICKYIKYNLVPEDLKKELCELLKKNHDNIGTKKISDNFNRLLKELKFNFKKRISEIENEILEFVLNESNAKAIVLSQGIMSFINSLLFIKDLTGNNKFLDIAKREFESFLNFHKEELLLNCDEATDLKKWLSCTSNEDFKKEAIEMVDKKIEEAKKEKMPSDYREIINIINSVFQNQSWNEIDKFILNNVPKESIKNWLKDNIEFAEKCIQFCRWIKANNIDFFKGFLNTLKEAIEELDMEETRKKYIKNLLNSERKES